MPEPGLTPANRLTSFRTLLKANTLAVQSIVPALRCHLPGKQKEQITTTTIAPRLTGGSTPTSTYVAATLDQRGALLGVERFTTTRAGYRPSTPRAANRDVTD